MDLKAELYRKQEQFKRQKLGQETSGAGFKAKSKDKVQHEWFLNVFFFYNGVQWLTHVSNFPLHMFLCRSPTSGINKMRVFQQELLKMQSSWKRSGAPSIQQGEFSTADVFLYNRWTKTCHSFFSTLSTGVSWRRRRDSTNRWLKETFLVGELFVPYVCYNSIKVGILCIYLVV